MTFHCHRNISQSTILSPEHIYLIETADLDKMDGSGSHHFIPADMQGGNDACV